MIIKPKIRGFICTTTHPEGCLANVREQIAYVQKNGKVSNPKVVRGSLNGSERIVLKVIKNMPKWTPGMQAGKPVAVQYNLPLRYHFE